MSEIRSIVIVGSGPAGYTAAIYAARAGLSPLVIAGSVTAGGALMNTTEVENFPGFVEGIQGPELMTALRTQAERFGADVLLDDVVSLDLTASPKRVSTGGGRVVETQSVILAMGSDYRKLGLEDETRLSGRGVSWCATCDGFFYRDQPIAVVGGGDSAIEEATFLTRFASQVYLIHRRDALRASKVMADRAKADPKIEFVWNSEVTGLDGDDKLTGVRVRDVVTGDTKTLEVDGLFVAIGHDPRSELVKGVVETDAAGYVQVLGRTTVTNIPGVFACGDLVDSRYRQAITAAGSGCSAALDAQHYLDTQSATRTKSKNAAASSPLEKSEATKSDAPKSEAPKAEAPKAEAPKAEDPEPETPKVVSVAKAPVTNVAIEPEPVGTSTVRFPPIKVPPLATEAAPAKLPPLRKAPIEVEPIVAAPIVEEPVAEEPVTEEPVTEEPVTEEPIAVAEPQEPEPVAEAKPAKPTKRTTPVLGYSRPVDVTDSSFKTEVLRSELPVVVDFWASWCAPCRSVAPILEQLAQDYAGKVKVVKVDADANPTVAAEYKVFSLPSLIVFKDGSIVSTTTGFRGRESVEKLFSGLMK